MPARVIARLAWPRTARAEPDMVGETAITSGIACSSLDHLRPLVDRHNALARPLHGRVLEFARASPERPRHLIGRNQLDVRLRGQHAIDEIGLESRQHRRHEDDDGDADRDAADDEDRLQPPLAQEAHRRDPFEREPARLHGVNGRTRWPVRTPEPTGSAHAPSARPSRISTCVSPCRPSVTGCL